MDIFSKLLGSQSPFDLLFQHLGKVLESVELASPLVDAALAGEREEVRRLAREVFRLEHEADKIKSQMRDLLPRGTLLPVARVDILSYLRNQDSLADDVEDLAMMISMRPLRAVDGEPDLKRMVQASVQAVREVVEMTRLLEELRETGFRGEAVETMKQKASEVVRLEHETDKIQFKLLQGILGAEDPEESFADGFVLMRTIFALGKLADHAEAMSDTLRQMVAK